MGQSLTKDGLEEFTEQWLQNNPYRNAARESIRNSMR